MDSASLIADLAPVGLVILWFDIGQSAWLFLDAIDEAFVLPTRDTL